MADKILTFPGYKGFVENSFWHKLRDLKLEEDKSEEIIREIKGFFLHPLVCSVTLDLNSFIQDFEMKLGKSVNSSIDFICNNQLVYNNPFLPAPGRLMNFNSTSKFKSTNKEELIKQIGQNIKTNIQSGKALSDPSLLNEFIIITHVNLKTYDIIYWFGFPASSALTLKLTHPQTPLDKIFDESQIKQLLTSHSSLSDENKGSFGVEVSDNEVKCITLEEFIYIRNNCPDRTAYICFLDPCFEKDTPGWPLRNLLLLVKFHSNKEDDPLKVISLRIGKAFKSSFIAEGTIYSVDGSTEEKWIGWEANVKGKNGPNCVNLKNEMDPIRLADSSAKLNLKLMKWNIAPNLNLEIISAQKCLLLGAGTLGCHVAQGLMEWGVKKITFVDRGRVSYSNPVRQTLYKHKDCIGENYKATVAAQALKESLPTMRTAGVVLDIPLAGHCMSTIEDAQKLHELIDEHDIIFLLTDSRESRWLPTVISSVLRKLTITAALGFESFLVMRHGINNDTHDKLGCYFCNDITAPGQPQEERTFDQQCTVTRSGVSRMASSLAVELVVSLLQHKEKARASEDAETILGKLPHSIRGSLSEFRNILLYTNAFSRCVACSPMVENEYIRNRDSFLSKAFQSTKYIEDLNGLTELQNIGETLQDFEMPDHKE